MPAYMTLPESGSGPGVVVICDMYGRSAFYENLAERIADLGYVGLCPEPFHRIGPPSSEDYEGAIERRAATDEIEMLGDLDAAITWMKGQREVSSERVGIIGFCMGGTFALNLAAIRQDLATCCFYGFPAGSSVAAVAAPAPLDVVDDISGPLIGFWGEDDEGIDLGDVKTLLDALCARDIACFSVTYPHVGHGFMAEPAQDERTQDAARHAWARMTAFLVRHLANA